MNKSFNTLHAAYGYAAGLVRAGVEAHRSRIASDQLGKKRLPPPIELLGVGYSADSQCRKLAPGGTWGVEVEMPGTSWVAGVGLFAREVTLKYHRFSAWYSRYLPYAYAMMKAEHGFKCIGLDFASINSYYGTCLGFQGIVESNTDSWSRIDPADVDLYSKLHEASDSIRPPDLPFDEVLNPCLAFVAVQAPHLLARHTDEENWQWTHAMGTLEAAGLPRPPYRKTTPKAKAKS